MIETCRLKNVVTFIQMYLHLYLQIYISSLVLTVDPEKILGLMQITTKNVPFCGKIVVLWRRMVKSAYVIRNRFIKGYQDLSICSDKLLLIGKNTPIIWIDCSK